VIHGAALWAGGLAPALLALAVDAPALMPLGLAGAFASSALSGALLLDDRGPRGAWSGVGAFYQALGYAVALAILGIGAALALTLVLRPGHPLVQTLVIAPVVIAPVLGARVVDRRSTV
jgi:hypothetical protein